MAELKTIEPEQSKSNGKELKITGEFCFRWGFGGVVSRFKSTLVNTLVDSGYKVTYEIVPIKPGKGEYYVYVDDKNNEKQPIFSNDQSKHKDAVIGHDINEDNVKEVIKKIEEIRA